MKSKRLLMLVGSVCLALMLAVPLVAGACAKAAPEGAAEEEIAALESKLAAEKAKSAGLEGEIAELRAPGVEVYELRLQHSWAAAENHFFEQYADIVGEMSDGRLDITVFSDGELVAWDELCDAVARGQLEMGHTNPDFYLGVVPEGELEMAPYLWRTLDEEIAVMHEYGIGDIYREAFEEVFAYHVLDFQVSDYGAFMFTSRVSSLKDFDGKVIMIWDPYAAILTKLTGASFIELSAEEIYTAMALGTIDGAEWGGAKCMSEMGFHEVAKYFLLPPHQLAYGCFYFINQDLWNELSSDLQAILREAVRANAIYMRAFYAHGEQKALAMMRDAGVEVLHFPDEDVEAIFEELLRWLTEDYATYNPRCERAAEISLEALKDFGRID